ncbi:MAG: porphobilinogen synthase [Planctomycetota bacterium]
MFPQTRMRRLRENPVLRDMVAETTLDTGDLINPLFLVEGEDVENPVTSMPGVSQFSVDRAVKESEGLLEAGIRAVILFGVPRNKDERGDEAVREDGVVQQGVRALKKRFGENLLVITDVCLCEYTTHGHCGILCCDRVDNDATLEQLARMTLSHVRAGADVVAPSDMMDGRVKALRTALDSEGFAMTPILAYSAKFASAFYGPFRDAADSAPQFGDRRGYQMNPANAREAVREVLLDVEEGADIVMVKKAAEAGVIDGDRVMMELLIAIKRAGADMILTYFGKDVARVLEQSG